MAKKTSGQNLVDEAYLRSLMAGVPSEPALSPAPSVTGESGENRETILSGEKRKPDDSVNETAGNISGADNTGCPEGRQGVYIDKELHQKISVIVGIAGKRQLTVGNYIDNVLKEHFEKHADEVKTYLQKSYNKIF